MERFSTSQAADAVGIPDRRLNEWCRDGLLDPARQRSGPGAAGYWRRWSVRDLTIAAVLADVPDEWRTQVAVALGSCRGLPGSATFHFGTCRLEIDVDRTQQRVLQRLGV